MIGIVMTDDGNVVELGKAVDETVAKVQAELPHGVELERVADQPTTVKDSVWEFERSLMEALVIVVAVSLLEPRAAHRPHRRRLRAAGARRRGDRHAGDGLEPRARLARLADHRARPAGGRRDHRDRDDGGEDGGGLGPRQGRCILLLRHGHAAPVRRADHGGRLHADRLRAVDHGRIRRRHLLDRRHRGGVLVDRLRACSRRTSP